MHFTLDRSYGEERFAIRDRGRRYISRCLGNLTLFLKTSPNRCSFYKIKIQTAESWVEHMVLLTWGLGRGEGVKIIATTGRANSRRRRGKDGPCLPRLWILSLLRGDAFCFAFKQNGNLLVHVLKDWRVNTWQEHFAGNQLESPFVGSHLGER